ncbi:MAG: ATP-binding cassette domain-containing protein [Pseudomonadota bacterium]
MIVLQDLTLARDGFVLAADCRFPAGIAALIGPSGAGKSTLLAAIAGFLTPRSGSITIGDIDITALAPAERPVSILFQEHNLFAHLSVAQNVGLGLAPDLRLSASDRKALAAALDRVGLSGLTARRPAQLSGGQRQRVALARALVRRRAVLLLDEPFAALGPALRKAMLDLVSEIAAEAWMSVLMVTHLPQDARRIATAASFVGHGKVTPPQPVDAFFDTHRPAGLATYLGEEDGS